MPELPEVQRVRTTLEPFVLGGLVRRVRVLRADVLQAYAGDAARPKSSDSLRPCTPTPARLLQGQRICTTHRLGKELALESAAGPTLIVHLGMSGELMGCEGSMPPDIAPTAGGTHVHVVWTLDHGDGRMCCAFFRDPRRFGGVWAYPSMDVVRRVRWAALGPDALAITGADLHTALGRSSRCLKAGLLDQRCLAGVGNIYADEALFLSLLSPFTPCKSLDQDGWQKLASSIRHVLAVAIERGGSSIRTYRDARGEAGSAQVEHRVYGRAGLACVRCGTCLRSAVVAQRTTVWCPTCQPTSDVLLR